MKVLLTGAAGRLGSATCKVLAEAGHEVVATDKSYTRDLPVRLEMANLLDLTSCYRLAEGCDAVIHFGNIPTYHHHMRQQLYVENCTMNINVFSAAVEVGIEKIIFASSIQAVSSRRYSFSDEPLPSSLPYFPLDSDLPARPGNSYALSKVAAEQALDMYCYNRKLAAAALRFPHLIQMEHVEYYKRWVDSGRQRRRRRGGLSDEGYCYLTHDDGGRFANHLLGVDWQGLRIYLPAAPGNVAGMPMDEMIREMYADVPLKKPVEEMDGPVDISRIVEETGWRPQDVLFPLPDPAATEQPVSEA